MSKEHILAMCTLYKRSSKFNRIDSQQLQKREHEELYWRKVLKRIISTIKLLSRLGVAFRGHDEGQESTRKGNYLTCLDYLNEYDEFLMLHLQKYANRGRGNASYLSHQICDEFISIIGKQVKAYIINEIKNAKYYSIVIDSTPDFSHVNQLTFVVRHVSSTGEIKERFLQFLPIEGHTSSYLKQQ
ncbi:TTF-type domain-containing protein, partial [Trichonephila clavata]